MPVVLVWLDASHLEAEIRVSLAAVGADELVVVDWNPAAEDGGRTMLLASVRDARELLTTRGDDPNELQLVGFGHGAVAAAGLARYAKRLGIGLSSVVAVAGTWDEPDPFSGAPLTEIPERVELVPDADDIARAW